MRVAALTQYFPSSAAPWAGHSAYQTLRLLAAHCDLKIFYPAARYPALLKPKTSRTALDPAWQPEGVDVEYIPYPVLPVISRSLNGGMIYRRVLEPVRAWAPDVILNYVIYPDGYAAVRIAETLGIPAVLTAIGSDLNRMPDSLCARLTRAALRRAAFTITDSADLLRTARFLGAGAGRSSAILSGCTTSVCHPADRSSAREALGIPRDVPVLLYAGRLDVRKGLRELMAAVAGLRSRRPAVRCYLLGDGPDKPVLEQLAARLGLQAAVTFVPPAPTGTVAQWMAACDVFTLPSYKEGCPNVVLEALASGRPVVATDVGGIPELMDSRSGELVPAQNAAALEAALDATLARAWSAEELASRHRRSWDDVSRDVLAVLRQVCSRQAHSRPADS